MLSGTLSRSLDIALAFCPHISGTDWVLNVQCDHGTGLKDPGSLPHGVCRGVPEYQSLPTTVTQYLTETNEERRGSFLLIISEGCYGGRAWWNIPAHVMAGHEEKGTVAVSCLFFFSFLFCPGHQSMGWYHPHSGQIPWVIQRHSHDISIGVPYKSPRRF